MGSASSVGTSGMSPSAVLAFAALAACASTASPTTSVDAGDAGATADAPRDAIVDAPAVVEDATPDAAPPACVAPTCIAPSSPATLGPLDCMALGWAGAARPSLPFYAPSVTAATVDEVVTSAFPATNRYLVDDGFAGMRPMVPVGSWVMGQYTGLPRVDPVTDSQRGPVDAFGHSGVEARGTTVGLWLNSMDPEEVAYAGSSSINVGCWYQTGPFAPIFPSLAHVLDVSFVAGVATDASTGRGQAQAYFQLIATDQSGRCGARCTFSYTVNFYSHTASNATSNDVTPDATGTLGTMPLAGSGLSAVGWIDRMGDSIGYQTAPFAPGRVHFRMSPAQLLAIRARVVDRFPAHAVLSTNPLDYGVQLLNVNGETYDPCKDPSHIAPCTAGAHAQLGMSVEGFNVRSFVPHVAAGAPFGVEADGAAVLYRDITGHVALFDEVPGTAGWRTSVLSTEAVLAGDPSAVGVPVSSGARPHAGLQVFFRDTAGGVDELSRLGAGWGLTPLATNAASDPVPFLDEDGVARVVYRDTTSQVEEIVLAPTGTTTRALTRATADAASPNGTPSGFRVGCTTSVVYRDARNHVRLVPRSGPIQDLSVTASANADAYSDPQGFVDAAGRANVVYRDIQGAVHLLTQDESSWLHADLTASLGAAPSLGSPHPIVGGCTPRIVYQGVDHHVHVLTATGGAWSHADLSTVRGAQPTSDDPRGYVSSNGVVRIVYRGGDARLHELYGGPAWIHRDL